MSTDEDAARIHAADEGGRPGTVAAAVAAAPPARARVSRAATRLKTNIGEERIMRCFF